jgi:hypothetical protein
MNTDNRTKINQLLDLQPKRTVFLTSFLVEQGYSLDLLKSYRNNSWLEAIGVGAMKRKNDYVSYEGAIYSLQQQLEMQIHLGGKTALSLLGQSHYLEFLEAKATLFGCANEKLPAWFRNYNWSTKVDYYATSFLPSQLGLIDMGFETFSMKISGTTRALMECLYLVPKKQDLLECYDVMESLNNLRPNLVQELLENCQSIKVKRLFLYLADKANHQWVSYLNLENIDLGRGKRSIVKNGVYVPKYQITVPKELERHGETNL